VLALGGPAGGEPGGPVELAIASAREPRHATATVTLD
jgi:hypothetical protein